MTWQPGQPIAVETKRFIVRTMKPADANDAYTEWWNDAEIQRGFNMLPRNWTVVRARQHIASFDNDKKCHLGIFDKENGEIVGFFTILKEGDADLASTNICIGNKKFWGGQAALEVKEAMIDFMFREMSVRKVEGRVLGRNLSSIAVYHGLKFKTEGVLRKHVKCFEGGRIDIYLFGMLKDEWNKRGKGGTKTV